MPQSAFKFYIFAETVVEGKMSAKLKALLQMSFKPNTVF